jgi:PAS domain S-box-containing protein
MDRQGIRKALCAGLVLLGLLVLAGWALDIRILTSVLPGLSTMKANTALCFALVGAGLAMAKGRSSNLRRGAALCGALVALVGGATLAQYVAGADFGIDEFLFTDGGPLSGSGHPGRMSPLTAVAWLAMGPAIILLALGRRRRAYVAAHLVVLVAGFIAFLAAAGYAFGAEAFWGIGPYTAVAIHTALGLLVAVAAGLMTRMDEGWLGGLADAPDARRLLLQLLPVAIALPVGLGFLVLLGSGLGAYNAEFGFAMFVPAMTLALAVVTLRVAGRARLGELALRESEARQRGITEGTPECIKIIAEDGRLLHMNPAGLAMVEVDDFETVREANTFSLIAPEDREVWIGNHRRVLAGESLNWEYDLVGMRGTRRSLETYAVPLRLPGGQVVHLATTRDVTERKRAEERQRLLIHELNHRVKNTLAIVQSLAQQTFKGTGVPTEAKSAFESRLAALARAHDLLTRESWETARLRDIVLQAAAPALGAGSDRLSADGPELWMNPQTVVAMTLAIHELVTNAVKYGALSNDAGRIDVTWSVSSDGDAPSRLRFVWSEGGGPPVTPPQRRGFGSRLIERSLAGDLGGRVELDYRPEGLLCTLDAPLPSEA